VTFARSLVDRCRRECARCVRVVPLLLVASLLQSAVAAPGSDQRPSMLAAAAKIAGQFADPRLREVSGLAASHRHADRYWVHNDSGDGAFLYAIDAHGSLQGIVQIDGVFAVDWEDIASFERDGKAYLLVADSGDNLRIRSEYALIAIEEPELPSDGSLVHVVPAWQQHYRFADASHDTEAMAVDVASGNIFLVPKFVEPLQVYRIPLAPHQEAVQVAEPWVLLAESAPPTQSGATRSPGPKFRPTALALAADGRHAAVLGYRSTWLYERHGDEDWGTAFARPPRRISVVPPLLQPEALGFASDGKALMITGEGKNQPLLRVDVN